MSIREITKEELELLEASDVCLNCNHREVLHSDTDCNGILCQVLTCDCTDFMREGEYSEWSIEKYERLKKYREVEKPLEDTLYRMLGDITLNKFSKEIGVEEDKWKVDGRTVHIVKHNRFKLPE